MHFSATSLMVHTRENVQNKETTPVTVTIAATGHVSDTGLCVLHVLAHLICATALPLATTTIPFTGEKLRCKKLD